MLPHKDEDSKERAGFGEVDTIEDIGRIPTTEIENYHGLTLSVVLIYLALVLVNFAGMITRVSSGLVGTYMAEDIGDPGKAQWLPQTNTIITLAFVTPISQIADYWGRKGPLVIASVVTCVGSITVSRATNMRMAIAGNIFASTANAEGSCGI